MFNNKFGLKGSFGYNSFEGSDDSQSFDTKYYRANLSCNLGRFNFETWTQSIGLLGLVLASNEKNLRKDENVTTWQQINQRTRSNRFSNLTCKMPFDGASIRASRGNLES
jgi:hypothetical protein